MRWILTIGFALTAACSQTPAVEAGPSPLGLDGAATYKTTLKNLAPRFKMRHQVETEFFQRSAVLDGYLIVERPGSFLVRATAPLGGTLFDVRLNDGGPLQVDMRIDEIDDKRAPYLLAQDIRRVYLDLCPLPVGAVEPQQGGFSIRCALPVGDDADGMLEPDDHLEIFVGNNGLIRRKCFARRGEKSVCVTYADYREIDGQWLAHRIALEHATLPYRLTINLVKADLTFDTRAIFAPLAR